MFAGFTWGTIPPVAGWCVDVGAMGYQEPVDDGDRTTLPAPTQGDDAGGDR
jgi:hypothetical protein